MPGLATVIPEMKNCEEYDKENCRRFNYLEHLVNEDASYDYLHFILKNEKEYPSLSKQIALHLQDDPLEKYKELPLLCINIILRLADYDKKGLYRSIKDFFGYRKEI